MTTREQAQEWAGAAAFIQHAQNVAGAPGHWVDEYLAWYSPIDWLGEHRAVAVFIGQKISQARREGMEEAAKVCESRQTPGTGSVAILSGAADAIRALAADTGKEG